MLNVGLEEFGPRLNSAAWALPCHVGPRLGSRPIGTASMLGRAVHWPAHKSLYDEWSTLIIIIFLVKRINLRESWREMLMKNLEKREFIGMLGRWHDT